MIATMVKISVELSPNLEPPILAASALLLSPSPKPPVCVKV